MTELIDFVQGNLLILMGAGLVGLFVLSRLTVGVANWLLAGVALAGFAVFVIFIAVRLGEPALGVFVAIPVAAAAWDFYLTLTHREPHDGGVDDIVADKDIA